MKRRSMIDLKETENWTCPVLYPDSLLISPFRNPFSHPPIGPFTFSNLTSIYVFFHPSVLLYIYLTYVSELPSYSALSTSLAPICEF